jgi:hypothetical protein
MMKPRTHLPDLLLAALALLLLVVAPTLARAQEQAPRPPGPPSCYPFVNGYPVGMPKIYKADLYWHVFWFCGNRQRTEVRAEGFSCHAERCREDLFAAAMHQITRATAPVRTSHEAWAEYVTVNCTQRHAEDSPDGAMCRSRFDTQRAHQAAWVEDVKWWLGQ